MPVLSMCSRSFKKYNMKSDVIALFSNLDKAQHYFIRSKRILKIHLSGDYQNEIVITWSLDQPRKTKYKLFKHVLENFNLGLQNYVIIPHFFLRNPIVFFFLFCLVCSFGLFLFSLQCYVISKCLCVTDTVLIR